MKSYKVLDFETDSYRFQYEGELKPGGLNPLDGRTKIIVYVDSDNPEWTTYERNGFSRDFSLNILPTTQVLIGHNIQFDLLHIWQHPELKAFIARGGRIYDTMIAEYELTGKESKYSSLDALSLKYGGTQKDSKVTDYWAEGKLSSDIPEELLREYAKEDGKNTELVALAQLKLLKERKMMPLIRVVMDHLLAITEMYYNGMYIDYNNFLFFKEAQEAKLDREFYELTELVKPLVPSDFEVNLDSDMQLSALIFGGEVKVIKQEPLLDEKGVPKVYGPKAMKAGQIVQRNIGYTYGFQGFCKPLPGMSINLKGSYSTDVEVLEQLDHPFVNKLREYRKRRKIVNTYCAQLHKFTLKGCNLIRPNLEMVKTVTGRLSCERPNMQNPHPQITPLFSSEWLDEGVLMEIDMSQLEVVMEAFISGCTNYLQDMEAGLNVHALMLSFMGEYTYEHIIEQIEAGNEEIIAKRKQAKGLTFAGQYGAGIWKLSQQSGLPPEVVKRVFTNFNARYPELSRCKEEITAHLLQNQVPMIDTPLAMWDKQEAPEGHCQHYAQWQSCFGSLYTFYDKGQYNRFKQFTRTYDRRQICNYPIQGSAAVLVGLLCGKVFRFLRKYEGYAKLRLEVHDSLLIDIKKEKQEEIVAGVVEIMNSGAKYIEEIFGIPCSAPFTATYKIGQTWKECK